MLRSQATVLRSGCAALLLSVAGGVSLAAGLQQGSTTAVPEPPYANEFQEIGPGGALIPLENARFTMESKTHNHFISVTSSGSYVAQGAASPVRVPPTAHFVIKVPPGFEAVNPATVVFLRRFVVAKGKRTLPIASATAGMFQSTKSQTAPDNTIPLTFKKYGTSSLEIIPTTPLPPGEYELGNDGPAGVFCFGVEAK